VAARCWKQSSAWDNSAHVVGADTHVGGVGGAIGGQGNSVGGSLVEGGGGNNMVVGSAVDRRGGNSVVDSIVVDSRGGNSMVDSSVVDSRGGNSMLDSSIVDSRTGNSIFVGKGEGVVDRESISLSLPLDDVLDWSILGNVLRSIETVGDSSVLAWVVVIGHSVTGNLWLGIDHLVDSSSVVGDSWGDNSLVGNSWGGNRLVGESWLGNSLVDSWGGNRIVCNCWGCNSLVGNSWVGNSVAVDAGESVVGVESAEEGRVGAAEDKSRVGFRLGTGAGGQSENYEHLHAADVDAVDYPEGLPSAEEGRVL